MAGVENRLSRSLLVGALTGVTSWTAYAVAECCFASLLPLVISTGFVDSAAHRRFALVIFGIYLVTGLILGGLSGAAFHIWRNIASRLPRPALFTEETFLPSIATGTVVIVFTAHLITVLGHAPRLLWATLSLALLLALAILLSAAKASWFGRLAFLTNPWVVSFALLGPGWAARGVLARFPQYGAVMVAALCPAILILASFLIHRVAGSFLQVFSPARWACLSTAVAAVFLLAWPAASHDTLSFSPGGTAAVGRPELPNVVFIVMDTVRADHLSLDGYGRDTTPYLRKFAKEAVNYTAAESPSDMTLSSHASLFTGIYPSHHGAHYGPHSPVGRPLDDRFQTLAEFLRGKGYVTAGVAANYAVLGRFFRLTQGFQYFDSRRPIYFLGQILPHYLRYSLRGFLRSVAARADREKTYRSAAEVNRAVFPLIEKSRACGRPLFLFVNYMDAHSPVNPPPPYDRLYPGKDETFTAARLSKIAERVKRREIPLSRHDRQHLLSQYDGAIAYLDTQIGLLMADLRASGLFDNSLIVITSDHGEAFGEKGLMGHGVSVDQNQVHVPLLIRYPNAGRRGNVGETVSTLDVAPTILTFLGFPAPDEMEGGSLLRRETLTASFPISESFPDKDLSDLDPRFHRIEQAIFSGPLKLVVATNGEHDLWNLARDPLEKDNLYRKDDPACLSLQHRLKRFLERSARIPTHRAKPDQDTLERLRSLGYLQ